MEGKQSYGTRFWLGRRTPGAVGHLASARRIGVVLANGSDLGESPRVQLEGSGRKISLYIDGELKEEKVGAPGILELDMLPRSLTLIEMA